MHIAKKGIARIQMDFLALIPILINRFTVSMFYIKCKLYALCLNTTPRVKIVN